MTGTPSISVIVPAFNEQVALPRTLRLIAESAAGLDAAPEVIVVDSRSTDGTARVAAAHGVRVVREDAVGISHARNAGVRAATGAVLVFIDADATFPPRLLPEIAAAMGDPRCAGGAPDARYRPRRLLVRAYLAGYHLLGRILKMSQGAVQFARSDVVAALGGYDETLYMGEDVEFMWRVRRHAAAHAMTVAIPLPVPVVQSSRRFDRWPLWRTLLWTNPTLIRALRSRRGVWGAWYEHPPR